MTTRRYPHFKYRVETPDGLVHRLRWPETSIGNETACGHKLATLYLLNDARRWDEQFTLTGAPATCLECVVCPEEIEDQDDES